MAGGISFQVKGDFANTEKWLANMKSGAVFQALSKYGAVGVSALAGATPVDEGTTSASWTYEIVQDATSWSIIWGNANVNEGRPIAVLLQYGHGTRNGGWVEGRDYINPALQPIFDQIANEAWKAVTS